MVNIISHIVIVEDEKDIQSLLKYNLEKKNYKCTSAYDGESAIRIIRESSPDLILLDRMLPDMEGTEICKFIRSNKEIQRIPIIILTAKGEEADLIEGFDYGADDYIIKPFSPKELMARISALLRRATESDTSSKLTYGNIVMDTDMHRVYCCDKETKLGPREYRILEFLLQNPGRVYSRQQLLDAVWGTNVYITDRTIDVHIKRIRNKVGSNIIKTIKGVGYKLSE
mgnify:CR=1 FL=1